MAVLRSGKVTNFEKRNEKKSINKFKKPNIVIKIHRLTKSEIEKEIKKSVASGSKQKAKFVKNTLKVANKKKLSTPNEIWNNLINHEYILGPGIFVLAKMNEYRPWPARINSIYKVGDAVKCYVSFYGTFQIGSVLRNQCVPFHVAYDFLFESVKEIKSKFKWELDYERISQTQDEERAKALVKLTQAQKFLVSVRDMERIQKIPYEISLTRSGLTTVNAQ